MPSITQLMTTSAATPSTCGCSERRCCWQPPHWDFISAATRDSADSKTPANLAHAVPAAKPAQVGAQEGTSSRPSPGRSDSRSSPHASRRGAGQGRRDVDFDDLASDDAEGGDGEQSTAGDYKKSGRPVDRHRLCELTTMRRPSPASPQPPRRRPPSMRHPAPHQHPPRGPHLGRALHVVRRPPQADWPHRYREPGPVWIRRRARLANLGDRTLGAPDDEGDLVVRHTRHVMKYEGESRGPGSASSTADAVFDGDDWVR
jgi:hypothetical protein